MSKYLFGLLAIIFVAGMAISAPFLASSAPVLAACEDNGADCLHDAITAAGGSDGTIDLGTSFGFKTIGQALNTVISVIFLVAGLAAFVYILLGAFNYLTAGDDTGKTDKARKMITNAVVGLILVALVYVIWLVAVNLIPGMSNFFKPSDGSGGGDEAIRNACEAAGNTWINGRCQ